MSEYADIIAKLEEAPGPDAHLDQTIRSIIFGKPARFRAPSYTASIEAAVRALERMLPGWGWRGGSCHLSDDCFVFPDYNCPVHGERLKREFSVKIDGMEWSDYTDIDLRPAGRLPIAILLSIFTALDGIEKLKVQP